jgi:hypothetical protein
MEHEDEMSFEDLALMANDKVDALIELLIEKKVITEKEYDAKMEELLTEIEDDLDDEDFDDDDDDFDDEEDEKDD